MNTPILKGTMEFRVVLSRIGDRVATVVYDKTGKVLAASEEQKYKDTTESRFRDSIGYDAGRALTEAFNRTDELTRPDLDEVPAAGG